MKTLLTAFICLISVNVSSQNITNTLGTSGVFTVKDSSTNYLTLTQSTGQVKIFTSLRLENTTSSSMGILFKGVNGFLHNYGSSNTFLGLSSGNFTMTGSQNTAVGQISLFANTTGSYNSTLGSQSLSSNTTGSYNTSVGRFSLSSNTTGDSNTAVGESSLFSNSMGNNNTALGWSTGSTITTGNNLTCIGFNAEPTSGTAVHQITLGNNQITSLRCNTQTITSLSDKRDKKNISDLSLGIDFLMKIKPRLFNWDKREWYDNNISDGSKMKEDPTAGFIAQELDDVQSIENAGWLNLVLKDNPEKLEATYGNLLPVMVKAIQELKVESDKLKVENNQLKVACLTARQENIELKNHENVTQQRLSKLEQTQYKLINELEEFKSKENKITEVKGDEK